MHNVEEIEIQKVPPVTTTLKVNESETQFEVDTGCGVTVMSKFNFAKLWAKAKIPPLEASSVKLRTYTGQALTVLDCAKVSFKSFKAGTISYS